MRKILMHDRIKQLWDTAAKLESDPSWEGQTRFMEKFAELIVKECAQVLETNGDNQRTIRMTESTGHDKTTDWMEGYEEAVKQYGGFLLKKNAKQIMKHFGVE
jgi:hypothetical protein